MCNVLINWNDVIKYLILKIIGIAILMLIGVIVFVVAVSEA